MYVSIDVDVDFVKIVIVIFVIFGNLIKFIWCDIVKVGFVIYFF